MSCQLLKGFQAKWCRVQPICKIVIGYEEKSVLRSNEGYFNLEVFQVMQDQCPAQIVA